MFRKASWGNNMDEIPPGFRPCLSCTQSCYKEHWPFPNRDSFRAPCFVKALCDSNLAAMATCWMVIPSAWLKLYGDDVGNSAILLGPSGNTWQVGVSRPKWVAFRVGWRTFAADNCLEKGDMLVFTLIGKSKFAVKIFDSRTCLEKESSLTATNTGCYDSRSPVLLGEKRKQRDQTVCENINSVAELKRICLNAESNEGSNCVNENDSLSSFRNGNHGSLLQQSTRNYANISTFSSAAILSQRKCSLLDLNSKPLNFHQHLPCFPEVNQQLLDAVDDRTLQEYASGVVYQPHPISIRRHDLEEGQGQIKAQECGSGGIGPATRFAAQRRPVMDSTTRERHNVSELYQCRQNSISALITSDPSSQALDLNKQHFAEPVPGPQILSPAVILERGKALELARRAQDTIDRPSHLVVLRAFHVHGRAFVRFPVTFGKQHMPRKTAPMHLLDSNGQRWPMTWLRDNETHMGLTRGWRDFCLAEGLSEGDVCLFELVEFNKLTLLIHVFRSTEPRPSNTQVILQKKPPSRAKSQSEDSRARKAEVDDKIRDAFLPLRLYCTTFHGREYESPTSSVGRVRLQQQLSLQSWASKAPPEQPQSTRKDHDTAYGEILCQMSSGCGPWIMRLQEESDSRTLDHRPSNHHSRVKRSAAIIAKTRFQRNLCHSTRAGDARKKKAGCVSAVLKRRQRSLYVASRRASVTPEQRDAANQAALADILNSASPAKSLVVMRNSNVYNTFNVKLPSSFCGQLSTLLGERMTIFLVDGAGHKTRAHLTRDGVITRGWRQFSLEHLLEEGDVCVFEAMEDDEGSQRTIIRVHIFPVVDVDYCGSSSVNSYHSHYRFISLGRPLNSRRKMMNTKLTRVNKSQALYVALRKTRAKTTNLDTGNPTAAVPAEPPPSLDLNLNLEAPGSEPQSEPLSSRACCRRNHVEVLEWSPSSSCGTPYSHQQEVQDTAQPQAALNLPKFHGNLASPITTDVAYRSTDDYQTRQQIVPAGDNNDNVVVRLPVDDDARPIIAYPSEDDSEPEEENYYRVVRILKKRYFRNEKQYLTELDGPVMHTSSGCEGIRVHDDIKWWVPEKSFSSGFASCYLR